MTEDWSTTGERRPLARLAHEVDRYVGERIRQRRLERGVTQQELAAALGISYQQVQKYENGTNRISAGRLYLLAQALETEVAYFFAEIETPELMRKPAAVSDETVQVAKDLGSLRDPRVRKQLRALVRVLSTGRDIEEEA